MTESSTPRNEPDQQRAEIVTYQQLSVDPLELAEKRLERVKRFINLSLTVTTENDWVDFSGKPYLQKSGAEKIARLFGIGWKEPTMRREDKVDSKGPYYTIYFHGSFYLADKPEEMIHETGSCSSRDKFFGIKNEEYKDVEDVDETNITKKAWTNWVNRGIKSIIGLNNLTWEQLQAAGLKKTAGKVSFKKGEKGGTSQGTAEIKTKIGALCMFIAEGDKDKANEYYHQFADFEADDGKKVKAPILDKLSDKWAARVYGDLKKEFEKLGLDTSAAIHEYANGKEGEGNGKA